MRAYILNFMFILLSVSSTKIDPLELKCLVCEASIEELRDALKSLDPSSEINVGGYQLDANGNYRSAKTISKARSEIHLSEVIDVICDKMENYIRATWKNNGTLVLLNLLDPSGAMNSRMSEVDIIQDDDLNKSLQYYCSSIMEEYEDLIIEHFREASAEPLCSNLGLCKRKKLHKEDL